MGGLFGYLSKELENHLEKPVGKKLNGIIRLSYSATQPDMLVNNIRYRQCVQLRKYNLPVCAVEASFIGCN